MVAGARGCSLNAAEDADSVVVFIPPAIEVAAPFAVIAVVLLVTDAGAVTAAAQIVVIAIAQVIANSISIRVSTASVPASLPFLPVASFFGSTPLAVSAHWCGGSIGVEPIGGHWPNMNHAHGRGARLAGGRAITTTVPTQKPGSFGRPGPTGRRPRQS